MEIAPQRRPLDGPTAFGESLWESTRKCQQRFVELGQVGVQPVVAGSPASRSLTRREVEHRKIVCRHALVGQLWELLADIGDAVPADDALTLAHRYNRAKHALVFCLGIAKENGWHIPDSTAIRC